TLRAKSEVGGQPFTSVAELRIISPGVRFLAAVETEQPYAMLAHDLQRRTDIARHAETTFHPASLIHEDDRDPTDVVLRRATALLDDIKQMPGAADMKELEKRLARLKTLSGKVEVDDAEGRHDLFEKVLKLRREIALSNPLLNFDKILFAKHHRSRFNHMCDQYYGINSRPGGGIFILSGAFSDKQTVVDVLAASTVENGRLKGKKLDTGSFVSPELSFDAKKIAFAYVECTGDGKHRHHTDPSRGHWHEESSFHVFTVDADGSDLRQLTDGTWNDFDPCFLPSGRIAFMTERRGGYLRCGRVCPTYTLFDMKPDGSEIDCLSYHETNEWHPSLTHDGRIIYTRWDYVDRHGCTAHMPWITTPDGRDSRAVHGNFAPRPIRPDMEVNIRAIPGSHKFVATAAPHHGQAYGSLVVFDPRIEDDDAMGPIKRITPEVDFPETQGGKQVYGTAWPLSEKYYLCVYDSAMQHKPGRQGQPHQPGNYGIYLVDVFGNKELIYRDPTIACLDPIPMRPRVMPTAMAETIVRDIPDRPYVAPPKKGEQPKEATLAVIDVYKGLKPWPEGTKIKTLRVVQILPMSVPSGPLRPHEVGLRLPSAKDSVNLCRYVLGTVPVEEDGSAHFTVPAHIEMFFQALDEDGLAVQSMRSSTYLQEGDNVVCIGCHEPKMTTPERITTLPAAMRRPPSRLKADVEGANPFSYPRLVQPVLDKHCVDCHEKEKDKTFSLKARPITKEKWYTSYKHLAPKYGFWNYGDGYRTTPGKFGARVAPLFEILGKGHYDVKLTDEEMHRITLWLDLTSIFYGVYEKQGGEAQLRGEVAFPTLQ
ncbi:MAG: hypothetical protein V3V75_00170, partial [Thermoguttaceae bacterium]